MMVDRKNDSPRIVVISGPTGVGKTGLAVELAREFNAQIINCDSMQVYRYMDVGTAKPTPEEQAKARHYLIDVVDPDQDFDAAAYLEAARPVIDALDKAGVPVIVAGGTGLYLRSLLYGLFTGPGRNPAIRARLKTEAKALGREALHDRLADVDPVTAARLHPRDFVRVERALEVFEMTGRPISAFQADHALGDAPYRTLFFCLHLERGVLYERIEQRTRIMFDLGLVDEVQELLDRGFSPNLKSMSGIGYKEVCRFIAGRASSAQTCSDIVTNTRRLAKRQLTWYRSQREVTWSDPAEKDRIFSACRAFWS
jgi:tRNA dimethylallyltransferase